MMIDVTVKIPEERAADFHRTFADWLDGLLSPVAPEPGAAEGLPEWDRHLDVELARKQWARFSQDAKACFTPMMLNPNKRFDGEALAQAAGLGADGPTRHKIAGVLGWPGRYCRQVGRRQCWTFEELPSGRYVYWMDEDQAELFRLVSGT